MAACDLRFAEACHGRRKDVLVILPGYRLDGIAYPARLCRPCIRRARSIGYRIIEPTGVPWMLVALVAICVIILGAIVALHAL